MTQRQTIPVERTRGSGWSMAEWLLGIFGAIAVFLGFFVMFGPEDDSIGLGGDVSWRVGDISDAWMYGLLAAGAIMLVGAAYMIVVGQKRRRIESSPLTDLLYHTLAFVIVNAFIWIQDVALGDGLDYALWVTVPWAIGLLIHLGVYLYKERTHTPLPEMSERKELQHH